MLKPGPPPRYHLPSAAITAHGRNRAWRNAPMEPVSDPAKLKAEATYNAAADHFDGGPLAFWDRYGRRTIERLSLASGSSVLDVGCGSGASAIPAAITVG